MSFSLLLKLPLLYILRKEILKSLRTDFFLKCQFNALQQSKRQMKHLELLGKAREKCSLLGSPHKFSVTHPGYGRQPCNTSSDSKDTKKGSRDDLGHQKASTQKLFLEST